MRVSLYPFLRKCGRHAVQVLFQSVVIALLSFARWRCYWAGSPLLWRMMSSHLVFLVFCCKDNWKLWLWWKVCFCFCREDCDVKDALHDVPNVFEALLQLLRSEYPVIQHQALTALSLAAENGMHCWCSLSCSQQYIKCACAVLFSFWLVGFC